MKPTASRALVVTRDGDLLHVVVMGAKACAVEICFDAPSAAHALRTGEFALVVLDDEVVTESERGWLIDEIHRCQPRIPIVYVAIRGSTAIESTARIHGVAAYAEKPIDGKRLRRRIRELLAKDRVCATEPSAPAERNERSEHATDSGSD